MPILPGSVVRTTRAAFGAAALTVLAACAATQPPGRAASAAPAAPAVTAAPATPLSGAAPLTLEHANADAFIAQYGIAPDSPKAAILARWREKMLGDPDIRRLFGSAEPNQLGRSIATRAELFSEGSLRVSPSDRSTFIGLGTRILDAAPADCGGLKSMSAVVVRYLSLANLSEHEIDDYFRITYESLKRTALRTPIATVNDEQRKQGKQALSKAIAAQLANDPDALRSLATGSADPAGVPAEVWCRNMRTMQHAVMAMPQPQRDWLLVSIQTDAIARLHAHDAPAAAPGTPNPPAAPAGHD